MKGDRKITTARETVLSAGVALVAFIVYATSVSRTVPVIDGGELSTVAATLGIAHPTGYPLFTILTHCFLMVPAPWEPVIQLNLFAALCTSIAVALFFRSILLIPQSDRVFGSGVKRLSPPLPAAAAGSLILAFSTTFWSQATGIEVYALHLLLVLAATNAFVRGLQEQAEERSHTSRSLLMFSFILGLSFSNHMTTILLAPGFLYLYFRTLGFHRQSIARLAQLGPLFLLGLTPYLFLLVRSHSEAPILWGDPIDVKRLLWHVSGRQYQVWMFSGWGTAKVQLAKFVQGLPSEFSWPSLTLSAIGMVWIVRNSARLSLFLLLLFAGALLYSINYDIHDIDSYFLLCYLVLAWGIASGATWVALKFTFGLSRAVRLTVMFVCFLFPALQLASNRSRSDLSDDRLTSEFTTYALEHVERQSVIFSGMWDYFVSPMWYRQIVRGERSDVTVVDKSLLQNRTWYVHQLARTNPWLASRCSQSIDLFLAELNKFEQGEPFDLATITWRWNALLKDLVDKSLPDHHVYVDVRIEPEFPREFRRSPGGVFCELTRESSIASYRLMDFSLKSPLEEGPVSEDFRQYIASVASWQASWLAQTGRTSDVGPFLRRLGAQNQTNRYLRSLLP